MQSMSWGEMPPKAELEATGDFDMTIKSQDEWEVIVEVVNQGIDSHLEAVFGDFDSNTGEIVVEAKSLHTFIRRLSESDTQVGEDLASAIMSVLGYEWI